MTNIEKSIQKLNPTWTIEQVKAHAKQLLTLTSRVICDVTPKGYGPEH